MRPSDQGNSAHSFSLGKVCRKYTNEWRLGMFSLEDTSGATLSVKKTFTPAPTFLLGAIKFALCAWNIEVIVHSIITNEYPNYWLIFLTHWQILAICVYSVFSFLVHTKLLPVSQHGGRGNIITRLTWTFYTVGLNLGLIITLLYWFLEFDPSKGFPKYIQVMTHGGVFILVLLDGMIINHTPIRLKQFFLLWPVCFLYIIWSIIHGYSPLGNPKKK